MYQVVVLLLSVIFCHTTCVQFMNNTTIFSIHEEVEIDAFASNLMKCKRIPGLGLAVVKNGQRFSKGYGLRDITTNEPFDENTISCGASLGKAFTAVLLAMLMTEQNAKGRKFDWETKVKDVSGGDVRFPDDVRSKEMTLIDLLTHRAGMGTIDLLLLAGYPDNRANRKTFARRMKYMHEISSFRSEFQYNNLMYIQAGYIAEVLGGMPYEDLVRDRIFKRLNMTTATFMGELGDRQNAAKPYDLVNDTLVDSDQFVYKVHMISPAGGVCASADDYSKWLHFLLNDAKTPNGKRLVDGSIWEGMWKGRQYIGDVMTRSFSLYKPLPVTMSATSYAIAWFTANYRGHEMMFHHGMFHAYNAFTVIYPKAKSALILTVNGPLPMYLNTDLIPLSYLISDILLEETPWLQSSDACTYPTRWVNATAHKPKTTDYEFRNLTDAQVIRYTGRYGHLFFGDIDIFHQDGALMTMLGSFMNITLRYEPRKVRFVGFLEGTLRTTLSFSPIVTFSELQNDLYQNMTLHFVGFTNEVYWFHRKVSFNGKNNLTNSGITPLTFCDMTSLCFCYIIVYYALLTKF
ncbi:hypothetical protein FSP39_009572 [Pinctada imbricata]|uniref:Beta-lactamase-related domain-containing protein n=1 Tax=Pinctada imbricata TaxID=66713 RepID=A0AA88Y3V1_PINIB|nr:hypothetical protein FSP39_009572 [Pinctada imbricata]